MIFQSLIAKVSLCIRYNAFNDDRDNEIGLKNRVNVEVLIQPL